MYESYIVDELGDIIMKCSEHTETEIEEYLAEHPEYSRRCIVMEGDYGNYLSI